MQVYTVGMFIVCCLLAWFRGCHMDFREALWEKTGTTDSIENNKRAAECAMDYMKMDYVGLRLKVKGGKMICESLPFDWLSNRTTSAGYLYMYKTWNKISMDPPLVLDMDTRMLSSETPFPGLFTEGSSFTCAFLITGVSIRINFRDTYIRGSYISFSVHSSGFIEVRKGKSGDRFDRQTINKDIPDCSRTVCKLTVFAGADSFVLSTNTSWHQRYDLDYNTPTTTLRKVKILTNAENRKIEIHSVEFKNP